MDRLCVPLNIYVLWHEKNKDGMAYARQIFSHLSRSIDDPTVRKIGIPIFFPRENQILDHKLTIDFNTATKTCIILLVDDYMVPDKEWHTYIQELCDKVEKEHGGMIIPVAVSKNAFNLPITKIVVKNYIRAYEKADKIDYTLFMITHEICRFLYDIERIADVNINHSPAPIKLFLSHAKKDGLNITKEIKNYIQSDTPLEDFFDATDIAVGYDFGEEIKASIDKSMLVVVHTDAYTTRDWCRKEILTAKEYSRPIVVLDCLKEKEERSFPYMANVPTLRIESEGVNYTRVLTFILLEVLRCKYQQLYIEYIVELNNVEIPRENILFYPPELFSLVKTTNKSDSKIIYPDPPLGKMETELLQHYQSDLMLMTPVLISSKIFDKLSIKVNKVGISISETENINLTGLNELHLQDMLVELARYLLITGCELHYGGDIRYQAGLNFAEILSCLVKNYNEEYATSKQYIFNYVAHYLCENISAQEQAEKCDSIQFHMMEECKNIIFEDDASEMYQRYIRARDLNNMRSKMNTIIDARIVMGGKDKGYQGFYPGILEETIMALKSNKKVFLVGAYGGITQSIIECIQGKNSLSLTLEYQSKYNEYGKFYEYYNQLAKENGLDVIDYKAVVKYLQSIGIEGLNNGLSVEENNILFESKNIIEIITLILKGLNNA